MKDKSLGIWLMVIFGLTGIIIIALAWLSPALESDRLAANFAGSIGIFVATGQALRLRNFQSNHKRIPVEVEITDKT